MSNNYKSSFIDLCPIQKFPTSIKEKLEYYNLEILKFGLILKYCKTFKKFAKSSEKRKANNNKKKFDQIHQYEMICQKYIKLKFRRGFKCEMIYQKYIKLKFRKGFKCDI